MKVCSVCAKPPEQRKPIDEALLFNTASLRALALQFDLSPWVLHRHRQHLPAHLALAKQAREVASATTLLERLEQLIAECKDIADRAKKTKNWPATLSALKEIGVNLERLGRLTGEFQLASLSVSVRNTTVNVNVSAETDGDLDAAIARDVADATNNFDPAEIARLKALLDAPLVLEGTLGQLPNAPAESRSQ